MGDEQQLPPSVLPISAGKTKELSLAYTSPGALSKSRLHAEANTSVAPLIVERSDAAVISFDLAMRDESSDNESLMSPMSHDGQV